MKQGIIYDVLPILKSISRERQIQFEEYFKTAPLWLLEACQMEELDENVVFVKEDEPADMIYFIVRGIIEAIDYRFYGIVFEFVWLKKVYAMGGMEFIMELDTYKTTLRTVTKCTVMKLPTALFAKWMMTDIQAMKYEAKLTGELLLEQGRQSRALLFLQGADRLALLLVERYEHYARNGLLSLKSGRQELSNAIGLSLKTVNRSVKKLLEDGLITKDGNKLLVSQRQYEELKELISSVMEIE